ncbi:MAG: hypothetical protein SPF41_06610 [Candidatus Merdousia sp.]|nr:hypothetical protein [Candidatus Merdousia sp.]
MTKKLVIRFVKFERALAMQILEQEGVFIDTEHVKIDILPNLSVNRVFLRGSVRKLDWAVCSSYIAKTDNAERDEYLDKVVKWISEEQFSMGRKLEIGKECMVSLFDDIDGEDWVMGRLLAILPKHIRRRYIIQSKNDKGMATSWKYARPVSVSPKIDGDVYTWEMEVSE